MIDWRIWIEKGRQWYPEGSQYWLARFWFQRALACIYLIAFLIAANQYIPLLGEHGLLPARLFLDPIEFWDAPSVFFLDASDGFITAIIWLGVALAALALTGISERFQTLISATVWALLWFCYLSLVNVGQVFYGFGWEIILLESGFLAIFLGSARSKPPVIVFYLLLWELFRIMFGAGMIKLRGDSCWRDLTCMLYHYETQPLPNPLSWHFHHLPLWVHKASVVCNHLVELVVPWLFFAPKRVRHVTGALTVLFQILLILSGNLSWLNYITIVLCIACFDDSLLARLTPRFVSRLVPKADARPGQMSFARLFLMSLLTLLVLALSVRPAMNLFSRRQLMNASFEPLHLVNTYGAFGSVTRERFEIVIEGTDSDSPDDQAVWRPYEFKGKPGDVNRRPGIVAPYQYKLDWQMWFAAMSSYRHHPWILNLVAKLLAGDRKVLSLFAKNPFPESPPQYIRAELYLYRFTASRADGHWWKRERVGAYLPPLSVNEPTFRQILREQGW